MEGIYSWLSNITCYLLFIAVLDNLLPGRKYSKYLKLFAGMVLILLVIQPFTDALRLEDKIAQNYEAFVFRDQAEDLKQDLLGMEEKRLGQMIEQYEQAVAGDISQMAGESGLEAVDTEVTIHSDMESDAFGTVTNIRMKVRTQGEEPKIMEERIKPVEKIVIGQSGHAEEKESRDEVQEEKSEVAKLRRKIASYYSLEETYVEIQMLEREG